MRGNEVEAIGAWHQQWRIQFSMLPDGPQPSTDWLNLLSIGTGQGTSHTGNGAIIKYASGRLQFRSFVNGQKNVETSVATNEWSNIEFSQWQNDLGKYVYSITVNGNVVHSVMTDSPQVLNDVYMYSGHENGEVASIWIRDLQHTVLPHQQGTVRFTLFPCLRFHNWIQKML